LSPLLPFTYRRTHCKLQRRLPPHLVVKLVYLELLWQGSTTHRRTIENMAIWQSRRGARVGSLYEGILRTDSIGSYNSFIKQVTPTKVHTLVQPKSDLRMTEPLLGNLGLEGYSIFSARTSVAMSLNDISKAMGLRLLSA